jgi:hypothetical protein
MGLNGNRLGVAPAASSTTSGAVPADLARLQRMVDDALGGGPPPDGVRAGPVCSHCGQPIVGKRRDAKVCDRPACKKAHRQLLSDRSTAQRSQLR